MTLLMWEGNLFADAWKAAGYPSAGAARMAVYRLRRRAIAYMGRDVNEIIALRLLFGKREID